MNKTVFGVLVLLTTILYSSCKKNVIDSEYKGESQLIIGGDIVNNSARDSVIFSFAEYETTTTEAEIVINAIISGKVAAVDRQFKLAVNASQSNVVEGEYEIPTNLFIPAGEVKTSFPVKIKRSPRLLTEHAVLVLEVLPNENFKAGSVTPVSTIIAANLAPIIINYGPTFKIVFTDVLTMPPTWNSAIGWGVGQWSKVKHQFIIDATNIRSFLTLSSPEKYALISLVTDALISYNAAHPGNPLKNENGEVIGICSGCP